MAGAEGFEPPRWLAQPAALPLGDAPIFSGHTYILYDKNLLSIIYLRDLYKSFH